MNGEWIVVTNWDRFQHPDMMRSSVPPWIKTWTRLLHDDGYLALTAHQRAVLHGLWLLYASSRCQVRANTASLSRQLNLRVSSRQLEALNHAGFIQLVASKPALLEKRREETPLPPYKRTPKTATQIRPTADAYEPFEPRHEPSLDRDAALELARLLAQP